MKYIIGILVIVVGCLLVIKAEWFVQNFGTSAWAEQYLGTSGGTRLMYKLFGIVFIILAMMGMTGMLGEVIIGTVGRLFGLK